MVPSPNLPIGVSDINIKFFKFCWMKTEYHVGRGGDFG